MSKTLSIALLSFLLLFVSSSIFATVIHVPSEQPTIQAGIDVATEGDTVLVADGTYSGVGNDWIDFHGKNLVVKSINGAQATILDGSTDPSDTFVMAFRMSNAENQSSVIEGFEIREFNAAGIQSLGASPTIKNCIFSNNISRQVIGGRGGAIFISDSDSLLLQNCIFTSNVVVALLSDFGLFPSMGGAIYSKNSSFKIIGCTFSGNEAEGYLGIPPLQDANGFGGAIYIENTPNAIIDISNCIIYGNSADSGGAIYYSGESNNINLDCNNLYENGSIPFEGSIADQAEINGNFSADPLF